ncbi:MBL fold metallo-hydrolase [Desertivirga brevis]|uniref:MBL fold metallo-hydrolase n=1 Tax=Desertivirga brevis TaxID=2810310 RepID=UPI001A967D2F|nr:MBL fold metallo-hydrolase [Pedobacter sp. SYSU D00873]
MKRRTVVKKLSLLSLASIAQGGVTGFSDLTGMSQGDPGLAFEELRELAPGVFFIKGRLGYFKSGNFQEVECNNGWIIFDNFVVLIDSNFPAKAKILLKEIRKTTSKPIRYVVNTHHHGDHLYANRFWFNQGAAIVSHRGVAEELRKFETGHYSGKPGRWEDASRRRDDLIEFPLLPPSLTFEEQLVIEDKNRRLELIHLAPGHTRGDAVAWLPNEKIIFTGDSCLNGPFNLFMDAHILSWIEALDKMQNLKPELSFPGMEIPVTLKV